MESNPQLPGPWRIELDIKRHSQNWKAGHWSLHLLKLDFKMFYQRGIKNQAIDKLPDLQTAGQASTSHYGHVPVRKISKLNRTYVQPGQLGALNPVQP